MSLFAPHRTSVPRLLAVLITCMLVLLAFTDIAYAATNSYCNPSSGPTESTTFSVAGGGNWGDGDNWSNGLPDLRCDAVIPAGDTVTLTTTPGEGPEPTNAGGSATGLTIATGATLVVEGVSGTAAGNEFNSTGLTVGGVGLTIDQGATLDIEATGNISQATGDSPGETPGGSANVGVDSSSSSPAPLNNMGTINASSSDGAWGESLNVGGTVTNTGSVSDQSGKLTFQGQQVPYVFNNTGTVSVASGAAFTMLAGDGSSFTNDGTFDNQGAATLQQSMYWIQSGGSETGNPVQLTGSETLQDSAGTGSFQVTDCASAGVTGTIPAGQTISVIGGCSGTILNLGGPSPAATVVNDGTLALDAPAANGSDGILQGGELDNHGTLDSTVAAASSNNQLLSRLVNETGATVNLTGGRLVQTAGTPTSNAGRVNIGAGAQWLVQGGSFANTGTLAPQIASPTSVGQFNLTVGGKFTAGGTLAPTLTSGYSAAKGIEFPFITLNGGSVGGKFNSVNGGFSADYSKEMAASNPYVGLVYGGSTKKVKRPTVGRLSGGTQKLVLKLSCVKTAKSCDRYTITATARKKAIFSGRGTVKPGKSVTRTLKLTRTGNALLRRLHNLKVRVVVKAGGKTLESRTVTVRWRK